MAKLVHEVWLTDNGDEPDLPMCCLAGPMGNGARALSQPATLLFCFEASSHFEAMTIYHRRMFDEDYTSKYEEDREPYPDEWQRAQNR